MYAAVNVQLSDLLKIPPDLKRVATQPLKIKSFLEY